MSIFSTKGGNLGSGVGNVVSSELQTFTNGDLTDNMITFTHSLNEQLVHMDVWNNQNDKIPEVSYSTNHPAINQCHVDFNVGTITGTWTVIFSR